MPVTKTVTVEYRLVRLSIDIDTGTGTAVLRQFMDGVAGPDVEFQAVGADLAALLSASPTAGLSRGDDATIAIYEYAVAHGYVEGAVS